MSGPKGIEIRMARLAAARTKNRDSCDEYLSQYQRLSRQLEGLQAQLQNLGINEIHTWTTPAKLASIVGDVFANPTNEGLAAVESIFKKKCEAESLISQLKNQIRDFIITAPKRHRSLCDRAAMVEKEWKRLETFANTDIPVNASKQDKSIITSIVAEAIRQSRPIPIEPLTLDREGVRRLEAAEKLCNETIRLLQETRSQMEQTINKVHVQQTSDRLKQSQKSSVSLADFMKTIVNDEPDRGDKFLDRLDSMLADVALIKDTAAWESLLRRIDDIRKEADKNIRRLKYESLVLECDGILRALREHECWRTVVEGLIDSAAPLKGDAKVADIISELEVMLRAGRVVGLEDVQHRIEEATTKAKEINARDYRRRAVMDSLTALGYEVEAGHMETALISAGKVYLRKPGERDYAVEIVANEDFSMMQTAVVRFADSNAISRQQLLRDKETEEIWCEEHARLRSDLIAQGLESQFRFKIPSGQRSVRVVFDTDRVRSRREAGAAPVRKRQLRTE